MSMKRKKLQRCSNIYISIGILNVCLRTLLKTPCAGIAASPARAVFQTSGARFRKGTSQDVVANSQFCVAKNNILFYTYFLMLYDTTYDPYATITSFYKTVNELIIDIISTADVPQ